MSQVGQPLFASIRAQPRRSLRASAVIQSKYTTDRRVRASAAPSPAPSPLVPPILHAWSGAWHHVHRNVLCIVSHQQNACRGPRTRLSTASSSSRRVRYLGPAMRRLQICTVPSWRLTAHAKTTDALGSLRFCNIDALPVLLYPLFGVWVIHSVVLDFGRAIKRLTHVRESRGRRGR